MLNWKWNEKIGTVKRIDRNGMEYYTELYQGNGYLIEIYTTPDDKEYTLINFWVNEKHAKNCIDDNLELYKGTRVILLKDEISKKDLKTLSFNILLSGGCVELV